MMSDVTNVPPGGKDREAWYRARYGDPQRHVRLPMKLALPPHLRENFGAILSALISLDPAELGDAASPGDSTCVLCGQSAEESQRLPATLHPTFSSEISVTLPVWVHPGCFDDCPDAGRLGRVRE